MHYVPLKMMWGTFSGWILVVKKCVEDCDW